MIFSSFDTPFEQGNHFIILANGSRVVDLTHGKQIVMDEQGIRCWRMPCLYQALNRTYSRHKLLQKKVCSNVRMAPHLKLLKIYFLNSVLTSKCVTRPLQQWHGIMGHGNAKDVLKLEKVVERMTISDIEMIDCETVRQ